MGRAMLCLIRKNAALRLPLTGKCCYIIIFVNLHLFQTFTIEAGLVDDKCNFEVRYLDGKQKQSAPSTPPSGRR